MIEGRNHVSTEQDRNGEFRDGATHTATPWTTLYCVDQQRRRGVSELCRRDSGGGRKNSSFVQLKIHLSGFNPRQQILITLDESNDRSIDVTRDCKVELANHEVALEVNGIVSATGNGITELTVTRGKLQARVAVHVTTFGDTPQIHFENDILPLLSKSGCNSGGCHGKASGQNGFKLSVFGFDSRADFAALTKEARGRRVFPGDPERSLLVRKATGASAHGGGRRVELNSPDHELLANWIRQGMPWGDDNAPQPVGIEVEPGSRVVDRSAQQQLLVTAVYSDGSRRDVTAGLDVFE